MGNNEEVIELSISETQALRAKLGLPPLRGVPSSSSSSASPAGVNGDTPAAASSSKTGDNNNKDEIVLSISETNALRLKIGLPPLKSSSSSSNEKKEGSSSSTAIHVRPTNTEAEKEARTRIEDAAAKRDAKERLRRLERENELEGKGEESVLDFAAKMLKKKKKSNDGGGKDGENNNNNGGEGTKKKKKKKKRKLTKSNPQLSLPADDDEEEEAAGEYTSADLKGIKVSHATSDFEAGTTTVLTLADKSILDVDPDSRKVTGFAMGADGGGEDDENELVNVNLDSDTKALQNLKKKRQIELGMGRAGGYAGYDDDEFEELGGVGVIGAGVLGQDGVAGGAATSKSNSRGFAIGADGTAKESTDAKNKSDIFSTFRGGAVSLQSRHANNVASDFMTHDDDNDEEMEESRESRLEKERAKQKKILDKLRKKSDKKKKMKKDKKKNKKKKRSYESDDDEDEEEKGGEVGEGTTSSSSLLASLEATAVGRGSDKRKRRRQDGDDAMDDNAAGNGSKESNGEEGGDEAVVDEMTQKRKRFDQIMEKGKARTDRAFNKPTNASLLGKKSGNGGAGEEAGDDDDEDDAFLNAALAKARRLKRLKEMSNGGVDTSNNGLRKKGEDAVVQAVTKMKQEEAAKGDNSAKAIANNGEKGGITFEFDEMQEFTRALRAREDQAKRSGGGAGRSGRGVKATVPGAKETAAKKKAHDKDVSMDTTEEKGEGQTIVEDVDMQELAQEIKEDETENADDDTGGFGTTAQSAPIGRGMSNFLSLLQQTGEIKNHSQKEEMRGRAKDKRTYEDYEQLDLKKVVNVDAQSSRAHDKDVELATREIKLEYRDDFGRLLTRKEAYRNMCYQFHGHGSSKKNQERRLKQIEREREEGRVASKNGVGTLGALKATQKATGKAFIIHKT